MTVMRDYMVGVMPSSDDSGAGVGVKIDGIVESECTLCKPRYETGHPNGDEEGYVFTRCEIPMEEMAEYMSASRSFQTT